MMDGSTKILTVSYGTFSCTLEGFDDPLGAMRDIAEYFRDLAADDRYFGAEPPTPDVEMLQSIAEKEVNRRVEARTSETGVALRQVAHRDAEAEEADAVEVAEVAPDEDAGAIAARVVSAAKAGGAVAETAAAAKDEDTPDTGTGPLTFEDEFLMSDEPEDVLAVDPSVQLENAGPVESVAEKLRRIREVVSRNIEVKEDGDAEDGDAGDAPGRQELRDRALTETIEAITADLSEGEDEEDTSVELPEPEASADAPEEDSEPDAPRAQDEGDAESAEKALDSEFIEGPEEEAPVEMAARDTSEPLWVKDAEAEAEAADADTLANDPDLEGASEDEADAGADDRTAFDAQADEVAEAMAEDQDAEAPEADEEDQAQEDTAEIKRTISDIIGNVTGRVDEDDADEEDEAAPEDPRADRPLSQPLSAEQEGDVGRLLAETDTKLNEDETVRRRRVISQMRAAVAATKADRMISRQVPRETVEEAEKSPYREDLSEAVVKRSQAPGNGGRTALSGPPLVLVSSQRVDEAEDVFEPKPQPAQSPMAENFADFAQTMGAKELPELLEAAAAYTVFGEGQSSFTRPEIMKRVAAVDPTIRMSREESLRSFGQLLRQGKFRKLERGQFTIDQDTPYHPKHRIAGE